MKLKLTLRALLLVPALLAAGWGDLCAAAGATNATERVLIIEPSSMPVLAGKATLTIGILKRVNGVYRGNYAVKVVPYSFKNEQGRLAIVVSDDSLAKINQGKTTDIIGTATTLTDKTITSRHVDAVARPVDINHGTIKLWFKAGDRLMIFEPAYHFGN